MAKRKTNQVQSKIVGAGGVIEKLREKAGISASDLADEIGVSKSVMSRYVSNERALTPDLIEAFSDVFGMRKEELFLACLETAHPDLFKMKLGKILKEVGETIKAIDS